MTVKDRILNPLLLIFVWALCDVTKSFIAIKYNVNSICFTLFALFCASAILIITGDANKKIIKEALKEKFSWLFALFDISNSIITMGLFFYVNSAKTSILLQSASIAAIMYANIKKKRMPLKSDYMGILVILSAICFVLSNIEGPNLSIITTITIFTAVLMTAKTLCAEHNPLNMSFLSFRGRSQVTGTIVLLSTVLFTILILTINLFKENLSGTSNFADYIIGRIPSISDITNPYTIGAGIFYGTILMSTGRYLYFLASKTASTDNLLIAAVMTPFCTWSLEAITINLGILTKYKVDINDFYISSIIAIIAVSMLIYRNIDVLPRRIRKVIPEIK